MSRQFTRFHLHLITCAYLLTFLVSYSYPVRAQRALSSQPRNDITAALGDQSTTGAAVKSEHHELKTDGVSATITVLRTGHPFPAGGSAFVQIKLKNTAKAKRVSAELILETDRADIREVSGSLLTIREEGSARIAMVEKIAKGKPRIVIVEVGLREGEPGTGQDEMQNKLKVTLRQPGGTGETATMGWRVANCASGFYSQIVKVREGSGAGLADAIKAARSKDRTRPGRWLFPPRLKTSKASRKCVSRAKRWNKRRGRYYFSCTKYETIEPMAAGAITPVKSERSIFNFASRYVYARAYDRELSQTRDSGWAANRVSQNLQGFLKQKNNPAICTGAIPFLDYFDKRMEGFVKSATKFDEMAGKSWSLALLRTTEAVDAARSDPGGHPGWGTTPLDIPDSTFEPTLQNQVETLAQLTTNAELIQQISNADNAFAALRAMSTHLKGATKPSSGLSRSAQYRALSAIEAADYIGTVARHYTDLRHALIGSMGTIRKAHATNCTCGG